MSFSSFPQKPQGIQLPTDVVMEEILTRLPAKSLMRFTCVSSLWSSHIKSRHFSNRFLTVPSRSHPFLFVCLHNYQNHTSVILSLTRDTTNPSSFVIDQVQNVLGMGINVSHNICGFIYYTIMKKMQIYNPTTRQLVTLPAINSYLIPSEEPHDKHCIMSGPKSIARYYFGYDHVNDQYKVICSISKTLISRQITRISQHWVFVLKPRGGSWKKVAPLPLADFCKHVPVKGGLSINSVIYYLASDMHNDVVVSFDISSEKFMEMIQVPHKDGDKLEIESFFHKRIIDYGGKVCVIDYTNLSNEGSVDLWVLEDVRNKQWSRKTLVLQPCQLHLVKNIKLVVNGTTQTGNVIFTRGWTLFSPFHILCYDLQSNDMRKVEIKGIPDHSFTQEKWSCVDFMFMDHSESVVYLET